jgi:hypothetical protein
MGNKNGALCGAQSAIRFTNSNLTNERNQQGKDLRTSHQRPTKENQFGFQIAPKPNKDNADFRSHPKQTKAMQVSDSTQNQQRKTNADLR